VGEAALRPTGKRLGVEVDEYYGAVTNAAINQALAGAEKGE